MKTLVACLISLSVLPSAMAQEDSEMESHVISGGGGTGSAGAIAVTGTIGQAIGGATSGGDYEVKSGFHAATLTVLLPEPDESFLAWMEAFVDENRPPDGQQGHEDEPAEDGLSNLLKYALGLFPMTPSAQATPRVILVPDVNDEGIEQNYLGIEFERAIDAEVEYRLEASGEATEWESVPFTIDILNPLIEADRDRERVRLTTEIAVEDQKKHFLRLRISLP